MATPSLIAVNATMHKHTFGPAVALVLPYYTYTSKTSWQLVLWFLRGNVLNYHIFIAHLIFSGYGLLPCI